MQYSFEKLEVWQDARVLVKEIYLLTRSFPSSEQYGVTSQLQRAIFSVANNLAEGSARKSNNDQARFYEIAYGSLIEVANQLILCVDLGYFDNDAHNEIKPKIAALSVRLNNLYRNAKQRTKS